MILDSTAFESVSLGDEVDVAMTLRAPTDPGVYAAQWQLVGPNDLTPVGPPVTVLIEIGSG